MAVSRRSARAAAVALVGTVIVNVTLRGAELMFVPSGTSANAPETKIGRQDVVQDELSSRRGALLAAATMATSLSTLPEASFAEAPVIDIDLPPKINQDPYGLLGMSMEDIENEKADKREFYVKRNYKEDTYQLVKHMKISASLDKGTPNMERFQKRVKEEMNDWVALYRRQDAVVGRQSYYALYSAVNTLSSHMMSYGPKFPFPNKRRPRFYQLIAQTEKYLEKGK